MVNYCIAALGLIVIANAMVLAAPTTQVSEARWDAPKGVWVYTVSSPFQHQANAVEVLLPTNLDKSTKYRVLYVLPVNEGTGGPWGDGLQIVRQLSLHDRFNLICVQPAFDTIPWYGAHASDSGIRHEEYLRQVLVPMIEQRYPTTGSASGRLLLGFSKSGWGAFSLILRNSDLYGYAASWDAPLMSGWFGGWGIPQHFGTKEQFEKYQLSTLLETHGQSFTKSKRLALLGERNFGEQGGPQFKQKHHTPWAHERMLELGIQHEYRNDLNIEHRWDARWIKPAVEMLVALSRGSV